jgi:hypothetical protein
MIFCLAGLRIDYLDRPTARRFVIVRPQDNTVKRRTSRSSSVASSASSTRSVSNDGQQENGGNKNFKQQYRSPSPSLPKAGRTFYGPFGSYLSSDDTTNINNTSDLMTLCEKLNLSADLPTVYSVQFILKSHAYDARMHFLAGNPKLANILLGQGGGGDRTKNKTELKVTQRLRLDQHKLDDLEKKLRTNVTNISSKTNINGQSISNNISLANQTKFAVLITSPKVRSQNGKINSPNHPLSSDENDKKDADADDESSLSRLISYLAV